MLNRPPTTSILHEVTPLLITLNEQDNLPRVLTKLDWARQIIVVDSGSTDRTLEIASADGKIRTYFRDFDNFAAQCDFGLAQVETEWVLSLDADYELSDDLVDELSLMQDDGRTAGYRASFVYCVYGRALRGTLYPPRTVLYRRKLARHQMEGHGHRVRIDGELRDLVGVIYHDDRKPLSRWFVAQQRYAALDAEHLLSADRKGLTFADRLRLMAWPAPFLVFLHVLLAKRCLLDGWPGWFYALQRMLAETMLALELIERSKSR